MSKSFRRWRLATKLGLLAVPMVVCALAAMVVTMWVSLQLDGGAAALNEAGRMRMQAYRMSLTLVQGSPDRVRAHVAEFERSLALLREGQESRPLAVPWDTSTRERFLAVEGGWQVYRGLAQATLSRDVDALQQRTEAFVQTIDAFVQSVEVRLADWTALLHLLNTGVLVVFVIWVVGLLVGAHALVLAPVGAFHRAMAAVQGGTWSARLERDTTLEYDDLAQGFNALVAHLQQLYDSLERKVQEKTAELQEKNERLAQLYDMTALVGRASSLDDLAQSFTRAVQKIARADAVALRWSDQANERYLILASSGLPEAMVQAENCLATDACYCGRSDTGGGMVVIPIHSLPPHSLRHCERSGFGTIYSVPIQLQDRLLGEVNFFYRTPVEPTHTERNLLEAINRQLASAMENLRHAALAREAAVSGERHHLSRELHDSIAQALAFLKIQVKLLRAAVQSGDRAQIDPIVDEIDAGVRECNGDVRELLMHFRIRTHSEDILPALENTLRKFEHQTGIRTTLEVLSPGVALAADVQIQVLHILQEALSNVRKHASATQVTVRVQGQPHWQFEVQDDGRGFSVQSPRGDSHVGLGIMTERAQRIGAQLQVYSERFHGTRVQLVLSRA